jgi:hypothetical protein
VGMGKSSTFETNDKSNRNASIGYYLKIDKMLSDLE